MRNDYNRDNFWIKKDPKTNEIKRFLKLKGKYVEVDGEVYKVCYNSYRKIARDDKRDEKFGVVSIDAIAFNDLSYVDMIFDKKNLKIETQCLVSMILDEIYLLDDRDKI